jgi:hypothetical protein
MREQQHEQHIRLASGIYEIDYLSLDLIEANEATLKAHRGYERALVQAFVHTNHAHWSLTALRVLFHRADRARLRERGDPLPGRGPFTIFRGVAGCEPERRVRGLSWTGSMDIARSFATRFDLSDPAVYRAIIQEPHVLTYIASKQEEEFIVILPDDVELHRVP